MSATSPHARPPRTGAAGRAGPGDPLSGGVLLVALLLVAVLMATSPWYGFDRDELYFLDCARHLQASYVDQPVLTPLLSRISLSLFGVSLPGLRAWPAVSGGLTVLVGGLTARELGGGRRAQLLSAIGTATMPALLAADHIMGPTAFDLLAWSALYLFVLRVERRRDPRWWLPAGAALGLGLANKHSVGFFAVALLLGLLASGGRHLVASRYVALGALLAAACTVPDLYWQAGHGWATVAMTRSLNAENGGLSVVPTFLVGQLLMTAFALIPVWLAGLRFAWRSPRAVERGLVVAYGLLLVFFAVTTGSKIYYLAGAYVPLLATGAVALDGWLASARHRRTLGVALALSVACALPIVLPVLPARDVAWTYALNQEPGESIGWPELVHTVRGAWDGLPAQLRRHALLLTSDYGEAGAVNELGRSEGLPHAYGDQNSEWWWGPQRAHPRAVVVVAPGPRDVTGFRHYLLGLFRHVKVLATLGNVEGLHNQEWGGHVYLCTGLRRIWSTTWRRLRHYD